MQIFSDLDKYRRFLDSRGAAGTAVAIGKFDGLHRGHQKLLMEMIKTGRQNGLRTVVFTFDRPLASFFTGEEQKVLTTLKEKREYLRDFPANMVHPAEGLSSRAGDLSVRSGLTYGTLSNKELLTCCIDDLIEFPVNESTVSIVPEDFLREVLCGALRARCIVAGPDMTFGKEAKGDFSLIRDMGQELDIRALEVPKVYFHEEPISSTFLRSKVSKGDMEVSNALLGRPYSLEGRVVHGRKLGKSVLHMPTVNLDPEREKFLPPFGVYFSNVYVGTERYRGITNIGSKPTVSDENNVNAETYLYDFDDDLYGENIRLELLHWHREERKFPDLMELKKQMYNDMLCGQGFFSGKRI